MSTYNKRTFKIGFLYEKQKNFLKFESKYPQQLPLISKEH